LTGSGTLKTKVSPTFASADVAPESIITGGSTSPPIGDSVPEGAALVALGDAAALVASLLESPEPQPASRTTTVAARAAEATRNVLV